MATTEGTSAEGLVRLFRDNMWKLHGLPESVVSDRGPQFAAELTKELNRMLGIETSIKIVDSGLYFSLYFTFLFFFFFYF